MSWIILAAILGGWTQSMAASAATAASASPTEIALTTGWRITQDVRELGEQNAWYQPDFAADWQPIDRLAHLQLLLAPQPYFGRSLRYFNDTPWWYRQEFATADTARKATLRFAGVDYFAKVWLNGTLLGEHEGYADRFEFEVGSLLRKDRPNVLVVKVSSPWDHRYEDPKDPISSVVRNLLKGSYEHADTFVQRDVNPVGIWRPVTLVFHDEVYGAAPPTVTTTVSNDLRQAQVNVAWSVANEGHPQEARYRVHVREKGTHQDLAVRTRSVKLAPGANTLQTTLSVATPKLWTTWDRGQQPLYEVAVELIPARAATRKADSLSTTATFGIRTLELRRSADETRFFINGKPLYLRGATYWPDLYIDQMTPARYERDLKAAIRAGINALRVHVHTENPAFYELCDRLGIALIQDNDLNWVFPTDPAFTDRAVKHFGTLIAQLRNHPSIVAWIAMNEVGLTMGPDNKPTVTATTKRPFMSLASQLVATAKNVDPTRPVIEDSGEIENPVSGDTHDYRGSLSGAKTRYFDIFNSKDKLVTEFGVDAPPALTSLQAIPEAAQRLKDVMPRVAELHDYQYRLLKYYMEHYRIQKYSPNAGYFQFMWIDFSPQSFYGVYDYWGKPKAEGLGGGLRAMQESNQPIGIFLEHDTKPHALYAVNDSSADLGDCTARWRVTIGNEVIAEGSQPVHLEADGHEKIRDLNFDVQDSAKYTVVLDLLAADGKVLAHNTYLDPFRQESPPQGFPDRIDDELGMRLWWAGDSKQ